MTKDGDTPPSRAPRSTHTGTRVTVRDIARLAGVSSSTVSRVLSNGPQSDAISEETRRRVQAVAAQIGYTPNPLARALKGGQTHLIGLIVREVADPFFAQFIQELSNCARLRGYQLVLGNARSDPDEALKMSSVLDTRHSDGVIVMGDLKDDEHALSRILENHPAVVALCRGPSPDSLVTINIDNAAGMQALFDHLYGLGHRRIAFLDGGWLGDIRERREAFLACMQARDLKVRPGWVQKAPNTYAGGYQAMRAVLALSERPTAVVAADDTMAVGALKAALDSGLRVPEDISVSGYDDIDVANYTHPALTTVRQPLEEMAELAVDSLLALVGGAQPDLSGTMRRVVPQLMIRGSTGRAAR